MSCPVCAGVGFTDSEDQADSLVPCKRCRTKAFDKWAAGKYRSTADREEFFDKARRPA